MGGVPAQRAARGAAAVWQPHQPARKGNVVLIAAVSRARRGGARGPSGSACRSGGSLRASPLWPSPAPPVSSSLLPLLLSVASRTRFFHPPSLIPERPCCRTWPAVVPTARAPPRRLPAPLPLPPCSPPPGGAAPGHARCGACRVDAPPVERLHSQQPGRESGLGNHATRGAARPLCRPSGRAAVGALWGCLLPRRLIKGALFRQHPRPAAAAGPAAAAARRVAAQAARPAAVMFRQRARPSWRLQPPAACALPPPVYPACVPLHTAIVCCYTLQQRQWLSSAARAGGSRAEGLAIRRGPLHAQHPSEARYVHVLKECDGQKGGGRS